MDNMSVGMTKDSYFEMCESLGSEPIDDEIPIEFGDLVLEVQEAFTVYNTLNDNWDTMSGNYLGKNFAGLLDIFTIMSVDRYERKVIFDLIGIIDRFRSAQIAAKKPNKTT